MLSSIRTESKEDKLEQRFKTAFDFIRKTCVFGATNKIKDLERTGGWSFFHKERYLTNGSYIKLPEGKDIPSSQLVHHYRYEDDIVIEQNEWYFHTAEIKKGDQPEVALINRLEQSPLFDPVFKLEPIHRELLVSAMLVQAKRTANCEEQAVLLAKYLWEHPEGIHRIECFSTRTFDHRFIVVNRSGNSKNPDTWGDAWILDTWYGDNGLYFRAKDFKENIKKIKQFAKQQLDHFKDLGIKLEGFIEGEEEDLNRSHWEVRPAIHQYPSYSNFRVEDYYVLANSYPGGHDVKKYYLDEIKKEEASHKAKFKACMNQIKELGSQVGESKPSLISLLRKRKSFDGQEESEKAAKKRRLKI